MRWHLAPVSYLGRKVQEAPLCSIKSPLLKGGGTVFGPRPRSYEQKINKKTKHLARVSALSYKAKNNEIVVVEDLP